jgi:aminoglycoside phosphotransferase (APT) family kinase protein
MRAIKAAGVPVPTVISCDSSPTVARRSFALMELVAGTGWAQELTHSSHRTIASAAVDTMRSIQGVPLYATGLGGDEPISPSAEIARWESLFERCPPELVAEGSRVATALSLSAPPPSQPVLVHGDYHYGSLLFREPAVVAVVDWDIAHLGDPLMDLGCLAVASLRRRYGHEPNSTGNIDVTLEELIGWYGRDFGQARWFVASACFKYGVILGYNTVLHRSGKRPDPLYDQLTATVPGLLKLATTILHADPDVPVALGKECG